jgi:hypothetical protein
MVGGVSLVLLHRFLCREFVASPVSRCEAGLLTSGKRLIGRYFISGAY